MEKQIETFNSKELLKKLFLSIVVFQADQRIHKL